MCIDYQRVNKNDRILTPRVWVIQFLFKYSVTWSSMSLPRTTALSQHWVTVSCSLRADERWLPSTHGAFNQRCFNVGQASSTLAQHWNSIGWMSRVCRVNAWFSLCGEAITYLFLYKGHEAIALGFERLWITYYLAITVNTEKQLCF